MERRANSTFGGMLGTPDKEMRKLFEQVVEIYPDLTDHYEVFAFLEQIRTETVSRKGSMSDSDYLEYIRQQYKRLKKSQPNHPLFVDEEFRDRMFTPSAPNTPVNLMPILHYPATDYRDWHEHVFEEPIPIGTFKIHLLDDRWVLADLVNPETGEFLNEDETRDWFLETFEAFKPHLRLGNEPSISPAVHVSIIKRRQMVGPIGPLTDEEVKNFLDRHAGEPFTVKARGIATGFSFNFTKFNWFNALLVEDSPNKSGELAQFEESLRTEYPETAPWITAPGKHHVTLAYYMR